MIVSGETKQAEQAVLVALTTAPDLWRYCTLVPSDFNDPLAATAFEHLLSCSRAGEPVATLNELQAWCSSVGLSEWWRALDLSGLPVASRHALQSLQRVILHAALRRAVQSASAGMATGEIAPLEAAQASVEGIRARMRGPGELVTLASDGVVAAVQEREMGGVSSWAFLDRANAALRPGHVTTVMAQTRVGKTTFALETLQRVLRNQPGAYVHLQSLEMPERYIAGRAMTSFGNLCGFNDIGPWVAEAGTDYHGFAAYRDAYRNVTVARDPRAEAIRATVMHLCDTNRKPTLVIVDFLGMVLPPNRAAGSSYQRASEAMRAMKDLAMAADVPVLLLAQVHRTENSRASDPIHLRDARDSGTIEEESDTVIGLWRPNFEKEEDKSPPERVVWIRAAILKNKHGECRWHDINFDRWSQQMYER